MSRNSPIRLRKIVAGSPEDSLRRKRARLAAGSRRAKRSGAMAPAAMGKQEALSRFSTDLTEKARKGEIDPIVGRDEEIRQIVDILMRRRQNNPILTGEAGVGKTAVVEGFRAAHRSPATCRRLSKTWCCARSISACSRRARA